MSEDPRPQVPYDALRGVRLPGRNPGPLQKPEPTGLIKMVAFSNRGPYNTGEVFHVPPSEVSKHKAYAAPVAYAYAAPVVPEASKPAPEEQAEAGTEESQEAEVKAEAEATEEPAEEVKSPPKKVTKPAKTKTKEAKE